MFCFVFVFLFVHCSKYGSFSFLKACSRSRMAYLRIEVLTAVLLRIQVFCDIMLRDWVGGSWYSEGFECLHLLRSTWSLKMKTMSGATHPATNYGVWKDLNCHIKILLCVFLLLLFWPYRGFYFPPSPSPDARDPVGLGGYRIAFSLQLRYLNLLKKKYSLSNIFQDCTITL
jgi:hypothetical protein